MSTPHNSRVPWMACAITCLALSTSCAGSEFNVTRGAEAVGQGEPGAGPRCSEEGWTAHSSPNSLYALEFPSSWESDAQAGGRFVAAHPDGTMVFEASAAWLPSALEKVPTLRAQRFADAETLSPWTRRKHDAGYLLEGIVRVGNQVVIARYLVTEDRYLQATFSTTQAFDDACRKVAVRAMGSLVLNDVGATAPADAAEAPQPAPVPEAAPEPGSAPGPEAAPEPDAAPEAEPAPAAEPAPDAKPIDLGAGPR